MSLRINEILQEKGKTQKWLSQQLDITEPGVNLIINERVNVPLRRLEQIANILDVSILELFEDYKNMQHKGNNIYELLEEFKKIQASNSYTIKCPYCDKDVVITVSAK